MAEPFIKNNANNVTLKLKPEICRHHVNDDGNDSYTDKIAIIRYAAP
ncbi:hypothetical protein [Shewanella halifaxensis]|nr:hypothetical protein [Shewanella halifaxensis]